MQTEKVDEHVAVGIFNLIEFEVPLSAVGGDLGGKPILSSPLLISAPRRSPLSIVSNAGPDRPVSRGQDRRQQKI
jgi:hypothetical protein